MEGWGSAPPEAAPRPNEHEPQMAALDPHNDGLEFLNRF